MPRNDNSNKGLVPKNDLPQREFPNTYLNDTPFSHDYNEVTYQDLIKTKTSNTTLPDLFSLFQFQAIPGIITFEEADRHEELHNWYLQLNKMISKSYFPTLEKVYRCNDSIQLLSGYNNTKEYLIHALVYNKFLVLKFIDIMSQSAFNLEIQMSASDIVSLMELEQQSDQNKYTIIQFLSSVMEGFHIQNLYNEMVAYVETTSDLSNRVKKILEKHSEQMIESLKDIDK